MDAEYLAASRPYSPAMALSTGMLGVCPCRGGNPIPVRPSLATRYLARQRSRRVAVPDHHSGTVLAKP